MDVMTRLQHLAALVMRIIAKCKFSCRGHDDNMWMLLQGAFADDWVMKKALRVEADKHKHISPRPTKASSGHASGASRVLRHLSNMNHEPSDLFKMPRFKDISSKVEMSRGSMPIVQQ